MAAEGDDPDADATRPGATALRYVGPATAAVLERVPFDAADIAAGRVSHRRLVEAGVNPGVAERLRREYGLLWAFRWHPGDVDLDRRAAALPDAGPAERRWIAVSADDWESHPPEPSADQPSPRRATESDPAWAAWPEFSDEESVDPVLATDDALGESTCPRCDGELARYTLGERTSFLCDGCGYAGVPVAHVDEPWRQAVDRILQGRLAGRRN